MRFSNENHDEGIRLNAEVISSNAIDFIAEHLFVLENPNQHKAGFPSYRDLPPSVKEVWYRRAKELLTIVADKSYQAAFQESPAFPKESEK